MKKIEPIYGTIPDNWKMVTINDLIDTSEANLQTGPFGTMLHASSYQSEGIPVVAVQHIGENRLIHSEMPYVDNETYQRLARYRLQPGDILFGRKGAVDRRALIRLEEDGWLQGSDCIRLRLDNSKIDPAYVSYVLGTHAFREWISQHAHGATMPSLNQEILGHIPLPIPSLSEQRSISAFLSSLDDKIELNRRMNSAIYELAKTIFNEWFINNNTGELGEISIIVSELSDRNFNNKSIQVFSAIKSGELLPSDEVFKKQVYSRDLSKYKIIKRYNFAYNPARVNIGSIGMLEEEQGLVSPVYIAFSVKEGYEWFLLFFLRLQQTRAIIEHLCSGSVRQNLSFIDFSSIEIPIPEESKLQEFNWHWQQLRNMMKQNEKESRTLASLRDTLLPKLMRGDVRVKDV